MSAQRRHTCEDCNRSYGLDDPRFVYWTVAKSGPWAGQNLDGRDGKPLSSLGWFAHCADKADCARARRANHATGNAHQLELAVAP
jgi:hypothetical protein